MSAPLVSNDRSGTHRSVIRLPLVLLKHLSFMLQKQKETKSDVLVKQNETGAKENSVSVTFPAKKYCSAAAGLPRQQQ